MSNQSKRANIRDGRIFPVTFDPSPYTPEELEILRFYAKFPSLRMYFTRVHEECEPFIKGYKAHVQEMPALGIFIFNL